MFWCNPTQKECLQKLILAFDEVITHGLQSSELHETCQSHGQNRLSKSENEFQD